MKKTSTKFRLTGKRHRRFLQGVVISLILIATPFLFYIYRFAPAEDSWDLGFFTLYNGGFGTVKTFVHALMTKLMFLVFTTIWFFTARHWWRFSILVPFGLFFFQTMGVINQNIEYSDNFNFWKVMPLLLPIVVIMIYISVKLKDQTQLLDLRDQVEKEIETIKAKREANE
ncbi:hypothetical protein ACE939_04550 [Aquimarina sp. W85]|uniref:hypothetical protein n=1 Tax=Aquimarina rhodophyticola TaxID=3342246 RepID=UPI00367082A7